MSKPTYDQSLPLFCDIVSDANAGSMLTNGYFVRDVRGALRLVVPASELAGVHLIGIRAKIAAEMGGYSQMPPDNISRDVDDSTLNSSHLALPERVRIKDGTEIVVRVIDQRAKGQDWLRRPSTENEQSDDEDRARPPRMVFWSMKGGVGRTTALAVLAAALARKGNNVLVLDLDLEAPGIGDQLLRLEDKPRFGVLDYLAEGPIGNVSLDNLVADSVGVSTLVEGQGLIHVCPAAGTNTLENPTGYLGKLFRSYGTQAVDGQESTFAQRIGSLIDRACQINRYDAVLIDARAGLSESTAASILNLGGDVLLFGHDTPQTFSGYRYALAHLSRFSMDGDADWLLRLKMVHAKASPQVAAQDKFRDQAFEMFSEWIYDDSEDKGFSLTDLEAPHSPWVILDDSNFRDFDPVGDPNLLGSSIAQAAFGDFIKLAFERLRIA